MGVLNRIRELEEVGRLFRAVDDFFSPGFAKYGGYGEFSESMALSLDDVTEIQEPCEDSESNEEGIGEEYGKGLEWYTRECRPPSGFFYPGIEVKKVPAGQIGYGILGRCFPYSGVIEIRSDLYGDDFAEVLTHEIIHMQNPHMGEHEVRMATRMKLPFTPRWH